MGFYGCSFEVKVSKATLRKDFESQVYGRLVRKPLFYGCLGPSRARVTGVCQKYGRVRIFYLLKNYGRRLISEADFVKNHTFWQQGRLRLLQVL